MELRPEERVLVDGNDEAVAEFASNTEHSIIVDWREEDEAIFKDVRNKLPEDYLRYEYDGYKTFSATTAGFTEQLELLLRPEDRYRVLQFINDMIFPDYEMRIFRCFYESDTHSFLLRSSEWWTQFSTKFPDRCEQIFIPIDETTQFP